MEKIIGIRGGKHHELPIYLCLIIIMCYNNWNGNWTHGTISTTIGITKLVGFY